MEERKFIRLKKEEFGIKEYIKRNLGKGKISKLDIEYTPVGEKIIVLTSKPGLVIGRKGEKISELTRVLKTRFKLENPHIEIDEIKNPLFDAQLVADEIAMALERIGNIRFKVIAYRKLQEIMNAGALGCELRLTGKLPSERAKSWRFVDGYLKKAGEPSKEIDRAQATGLTKTGIIGIKVAIMSPDAKIYDRIDINDEVKARINQIPDEVEEEPAKKKKKTRKKAVKAATKEVKEVIEKVDVKSDKKEKSDLMETGVVKVVDEKSKVKPEEDGTAIAIETEIEEGVPQEQIDKELKEAEEEHKEKLDEVVKGSEKDKKEEDVKDNVEDKK
ncbi:30S ribosomal protein S3 [archaeon]|jgi:small subunit ribosomal protein S3|nr:30S ribosomal protein S3 [archaeon]MBT4242114.1 30S ribosomal protein S3 [archaeon]MBT4417802.1 30S ribosomal protein S3 [archaeon]